MDDARKNMGDVCKDLSSHVEGRKKIFSEGFEQDRDSESKWDGSSFYLQKPIELETGNGINDILEILSKEYEDYHCAFSYRYDPERLNFFIMMVPRRTMKPIKTTVMFSEVEISRIKNYYDFILWKCKDAFDKVINNLKGEQK